HGCTPDWCSYERPDTGAHRLFATGSAGRVPGDDQERCVSRTRRNPPARGTGVYGLVSERSTPMQHLILWSLVLIILAGCGTSTNVIETPEAIHVRWLAAVRTKDRAAALALV